MNDRGKEPIRDAEDPSEAALDAMLAAADDGLLKAIRRSLDLDVGLAQIIGQPPLRETFLPVSAPPNTPQSKQLPKVSGADSRFPGAAAGLRYQPSPGERAMARRPSTTWDTKPHKPIFYGPVARLADRFAGRGDGKAAIPALPVGPAEVIDAQAGTTPYLEIRRRHFLDHSEREYRQMLIDIEPVFRQLAALRQDIVAVGEKVTEIRERPGSIPPVPAEAVLASRNVAEQRADEVLVRARRQREHDARRAAVLAEEQQAVEKIRALRIEEARLTEMIAAREQILATRVRQLHEHALRRCGTYMRHLVRKHPDGAALIPFLYLARPALPDWFQHRTQGSGPPMT